MDLCVSIPFRSPRVVAGTCLLLLTAMAATPCLHAEGKQGRQHKESKRADTREIEGLEGQWRGAMVKGDSDALGKLLSEDFFGISANGTVSNKEQYLYRLSKRQNQFTSIDLMDQKVRMQSTTAIVVSQARVTGQLDGRSISGVFRYTKVYGREAGVWRVLNFEATRVSPLHEDDPEMQRGMPLSPQAYHH